MKTFRTTFSLIFIFLLTLIIFSLPYAEELYPLYPKLHRSGQSNNSPQNYPQTDDYFTIQHCDEIAEYYLGYGAADDTFFIVFEPPVACSVKYVEAQWYDAGNVTAFAAWYNPAAQELYPSGQAPPRGQSPVSPVGQWITDPVPNTVENTMEWETLDLGGQEFIVGNVITLEPAMFGIGFIKQSALPHPLADDMSTKGIRFTYTWFGGPWMPSHGYPQVWGAYSANLATGTVIEDMMRVWVTYPWGMPIIIWDVSQQSNTYSLTGPFPITCRLEDDGVGINNFDIIQLRYTVNSGDTIIVPLTDVPPIGDGKYGADIQGNFSVGDEISYWIYTMDDDELVNSTEETPFSFEIVAPANPQYDLLLVEDREYYLYFDPYYAILNEFEVSYEVWNIQNNNGIDQYVLSYGGGNVFVINGGYSTTVSSVPTIELLNPYSTFLDGGGHLFFTGNNYFSADLPDTGYFEPGTFAYDYFGIEQYFANPSNYDTAYYGVLGNPISGSFAYDPLITDTYILEYYYGTIPDHFIPVQDYRCLWGSNNEMFYGSNLESGFKTIFLSFRALAACEYDTNNYEVIITDQFRTLIQNILTWFDVPFNSVNNTPINFPQAFEVYPNYPNPFNPQTTISLTLSEPTKLELTVYNLQGQKVEKLFEGNKSAGVYEFIWNAQAQPSGVYFYRCKTDFGEKEGRMILLK